jgi:hypothetical protein
MFKFDRTDMQRIATAAVGALILSTVSVAAAVAPAQAGGSSNAVVASSNRA